MQVAPCLGLSEPGPEAVALFQRLDQAFLDRHSRILADSYRHWTGKPLLDSEPTAEALFHAPFALLSHGTETDPLFNYANARALMLFGMRWEDIIGLPSRYSAEPMLREAREALLARVAAHGYVDDYSGVRIAKDGRRFTIRNATVWNLLDAYGRPYGQAAMIREHLSINPC